ncbi:MAG: magnesium transporter [Stomatobaculum sp.]
MAEEKVNEIEEEEARNEALLTLVRESKFRTLRQELSEMNEVDVAAFIEELDPEKTVVIFRLLPKELASDVFACLELDKQQHIVSSITDKELTTIIEDLSVDDAVDMVEELPANIVKRVLQNATPETRAQINEFLKYPENSAGSIMTAEYIGLRKTMTIEEAFSYIRQHGVDKETIYTCYVMDNKRTLEGVVTVKDLLMNPYETMIEDVMDTRVIKAQTTDDREDVVDLFNKYDLTTLPVVDKEERLVGIVTIDDAIDVMEEEATEDFEKMAAITPSEKPYLKTGVFEMARNRIPWLLILMVSAMLTGGILASYEAAFAVLPILVTFVPQLMDTGGNAGSQASTMVIRGMAIGDIELRDVLKVLWKEIRVGLLCGLVLATINFIRIMIFYPGQQIVGFVVVMSMFLTVIMAKIIGCLLPMAAQRIGIDPAIMASPLITTIVDAISLTVYFEFATRFLNLAGA